MTKKTIAVIGGTGKSGIYVVKQLADRGFGVRMLVRDVTKVGTLSALVEVVTGDVCDYEAVVSVMRGCDGVISTLGQSPGAVPPFSVGTGHILRAMVTQGIRRYVVVTGLSIDVPTDKKGVRTQQLSAYMRSSYPATIADKQREYELLAESTVDWTLVRLPLIEQSEMRGDVAVSEEDCPGEKIRAGDLAAFLVGQLADRRYVRKAPFIASVG